MGVVKHFLLGSIRIKPAGCIKSTSERLLALCKYAFSSNGPIGPSITLSPTSHPIAGIRHGGLRERPGVANNVDNDHNAALCRVVG